ncbi:hypothetical protein FB451DRAFT_1230995 [Mycena latifolia]|nr:hypothetical protein FB451DRAFT_1230995 [Mycena latifolia]
MVLVEALALHYGDGDDDFPGDATPGTGPTLRGTLLARNAAFEKHLSVRFTLDAWGTAGEVRARCALPSLSPCAGSYCGCGCGVGGLRARPRPRVAAPRWRGTQVPARAQM